GTGEIGAALARRGPYVGLDLSLGMLRVFHDRLSGTRREPLLAQADADRPWPVRSGWARIVFASRAAHLFAKGHLIAETLRVASPEGAVFGLGRVRRDPGSLRATLRREMRRLLAGHGIEGRGGERAREDLMAAFAEQGGEILPPRTAATWPVSERAGDSLASWRGKPGLAGTAVPEDVKRNVLDRLEEWAREKYGDLDSIQEAAESYELTAVRLPPRL
ncbi:MAG TPA: class I SAM-dependent methyltransferase, partial [Thermoanaerobaculia bacterium]|nr:class I SAM-dependent methyltransferase [Thermoanaerobaculia bacterium]